RRSGSETRAGSRSARDTVIGLTPARAATSAMVVRPFLRLDMLPLPPGDALHHSPSGKAELLALTASWRRSLRPAAAPPLAKVHRDLNLRHTDGLAWWPAGVAAAILQRADSGRRRIS